MRRYFPTYIQRLFWCILMLSCCNLMLIGWLVVKTKDLRFALDDLSRSNSELLAIRTLKAQVPPEISNAGENSTEVENVRTALKKASIAERSIQTIAISGRFPIKKTSFEKVDTTLVLKKIRLEEILSFIDAYEQGNSDSVCSRLEIRVGESPELNAGSVASVELILSQLVKAQ